MNVKIDLTFPTQYCVERLWVLPSDLEEEESIFYFPPCSSDRGPTDFLVRVCPNLGKSWIGAFAFGYDSPKAITGVYSCPDETSVCVISSGQGYIIKANNPNICEKVEVFPVLDVRSALPSNLLLFADFTIIAAYGPQGHTWTTSRLSWDGLEITDVTNTYIKGIAWDAPQQREVEFIVNIETGQHEGGSSPEQYPSH
jgi:hypothetical protein